MKRTLVILFCGAALAAFAAGSGSSKYRRYIERADALYQDFVYLKAIEYYKKAIEEEADMSYPALRIADCYRLINDNESAVQWYERVVEELSEEDRQFYAQALLQTGNPEKAGEIASSLKATRQVMDRFENLERRGEFFRDSAAYLVVQSSDMNSPESDFSPTYYGDGVVFVSNRKSTGFLQSTYYWDESYFLDLYLENSETTEPVQFSKRINTIFHEGPAAFYDNGKKVVFTRNNFNSGRKNMSKEGVNKLKLFYSERKEGKANWSKPVELPFNSDEYAVGHPTVTEDGTTMYFASDMPGTVGKADIFKSTYVNGAWSRPERLSDQINTSENELFPFIQDGHVLYFASEGHAGIGGLDIYKVDLNDPVQKVINLGYPINSERDDFGLILDGHKGYFSSNREGGLGKDDIYEFDLFLFDVVAMLRDQESKALLSGDLEVVETATNEVIAVAKGEQSVQFQGMRGHTYAVRGASTEHQPSEIQIATINFPKEEWLQEVDIFLEGDLREMQALVVHNYGKTDQVFTIQASVPESFDGSEQELLAYATENHLQLNNVMRMQSIYYDFNQYNIREDAARELLILARTLSQYPGLQVVLSSHTDIRGSAAYNQQLSGKRALAARDFLVAQGISPERIRTQVHGELEPAAPCVTEPCEEPVHQLNRRTEIRIEK